MRKAFRVRTQETYKDCTPASGAIIPPPESSSSQFTLPYVIIRERKSVLKYKIVLQNSEEGFAVSCPALPGCWSQGETEEEAMNNIQEAIQEYLAVINDRMQGEMVREVEIAA